MKHLKFVLLTIIWGFYLTPAIQFVVTAFLSIIGANKLSNYIYAGDLEVLFFLALAWSVIGFFVICFLTFIIIEG